MGEVQADAPGRVNLIGEHTDYQEGFVLPCAVPQRTRVRLQLRADRRVRAWTAAAGYAPIDYAIGDERKGLGWGDYIQGLTWVLARQGVRCGGFDLRVDSDVPVGGGLSSSAALAIAALRAMRTAFDLPLDDVALARAAQLAETDFVGAPVGIMDQMASSLGREGEALFLDTRTLQFDRVLLPPGMDLIVIDSGLAHQHAGGEYAVRRRESEEAARLLGVACLRDVAADSLPRLAALPPRLARRARHVITENTRVLEARAALHAGNLAALGALFNASHASLRDDYEVSVPAVDRLVELAASDSDVFGARMTGGGFGGAIVAVAAGGTGAATATRLRDAYAAGAGRHATVLLPVHR